MPRQTEKQEACLVQSQLFVQTLETFFTEQWGEVTQIKVYSSDYQQLSWLQVWQGMAEIYPDHWALELYPPVSELVNDDHVYHLWLMSEQWRPPLFMNLAEKYRSR